jgi:NAD(P)-dependent dehydrogenase (short-subunit alcohol dehydrogenase family)
MTAHPDHLSAARLDGKAIIVLGAGGGGIGTATCAALAGAGARLFCVDRDAAQAETAAAASGGIAHAADVLDRLQMDELFGRADELFGASLSGVVDIVAFARSGSIASFDDEALTLQLDIVLRHAILAVQYGGPLLARNGGGTMAFVGSMSGDRAVRNQSIYGIAKAALHHLMRSAANELGPGGVRVNGVAPGFVRTPRLLEALPSKVWDGIAAVNPLGRCAEPADIAKALLYLSSDMSSYLNGNILRLDGGYGDSYSLPGLDVPLGGGS